MYKASILYLLLAIFLLIPFSQDIAYSVVPGWNTPIFPPYMIAHIILCLWTFIMSGVYFLLYFKNKKIQTGYIIAHFCLSLPLPLFLKFPFTRFSNSYIHDFKAQVDISYQWIIAFMILFFIGQVLFGYAIMKNVRVKTEVDDSLI